MRQPPQDYLFLIQDSGQDSLEGFREMLRSIYGDAERFLVLAGSIRNGVATDQGFTAYRHRDQCLFPQGVQR